MALRDTAGVPPLLQGYSIVEWPDLTCDRHPSPTPYTSTQPLSSFNVQSRGSLLLAAISRMLGAYCGASDILLAVQVPNKRDYVFVRVNWSDNETWQEVAARTASQTRKTKSKLLVGDIRRAFELPDKQNPCPVLVRFTPSEEPSYFSDFPAVFIFDAKKSSLTLSAPKSLLHPSINDQLLSQIISLYHHAGANPKTPVSSNPTFPSHLTSVYDRLPEEDISNAYPHIPLVKFATEYLERRAKTNPHDIAVRWFPELSIDDSNLPSETSTYEELDRKASQLGRWLVTRGLAPEDRVAVCLSRDLIFHAAFFGIMRAGGCYVPIDPELPDERKAYIARDSGAKFVLTTSELSSQDLFGSSTIYVDEPEVANAIDEQDGGTFNIATPEGLGYMLYTSGTTGNPKGCLLTNHGLAQAIIALSSTAADVRMKDIREGRYLAVASIAFDVHLAETIVPMALGMPLLSAPRSQLLENLPQYVKLLGITHLGIVPSLIEATLNASKDNEGGLALRYIASGGEKMSDSILDKWANHPQVRLANFYGPSEVTIGCCARYMDSNTPRANIGRPLANVSGYVVDADLNILPRGGVGELVVEGPLVGRGYHGRPDLTEKVFLEWPEKGRWAYRTGDLVRMMPDSTLEILGRIDTQIKVRGVRIESEGISAIVRKAEVPSADMVLDATTVLAKHPALGSEQLVSFVTWDSTVPVSTRKSLRPSLSIPPRGFLKSIRSICNKELASYMRPNHVIPLNWLPLSSNGKTDTKILVELFKNLDIAQLASLISSEDDVSVSRDCTPLEAEVFEIVQRHAPSYAQRPHPELNIFECGLDSMGVIRFAADLKLTFGKAIPATEIMKKPALQDIAQLVHVSTMNHSLVGTPLPTIDAATHKHLSSIYSNDIEDILPPFPVQEGVLARSVEDTSLYVQHVILHLDSGTSMSQLQRSWESVIAAHPILRTVFYVDRSVWQVVFKSFNLPNSWSDRSLSVKTVEEFRARFYSRFAGEITKDINRNLSSIPPFRLAYFRCTGFNVLVLSIHHALYDGTSLPVLLRDVENSYLGLERVQKASLRAILAEISKHDLALAQQFWRDSFREFEWPRPAFRQGSNALASSVKYLSVHFTQKLSVIREVANKKQVTLQALLSFTFAYLIGSRLYDSNDVAFGVIRSGRMLPVDNVDVALCPTITVLPMRVRLGDANSTLVNIQNGISTMTEHEHVPLGKVQNWLRPGEPLFEVLFSVSVQQQEESKIWRPCDYEPPAADYALSVEAVVNVHDDTLIVRAAWLDGLITQDHVADLLHGFEKVTLTLDKGEELPLPSRRSPEPVRKVNDDEDPSAQVLLDPVVVADLQQTICDFLEIPTAILTNRVSFISLGLDSIKAVGLAKRIRALGYDVSSTEILRASTLKRLARVVSNNKQKKEEPYEHYAQLVRQVEGYISKSEVQLSPEDEVKIIPSTALQSGMLSQTVGSDGRLYVHAFPLTLSPGVDVQRLKSAWEAAAEKIDILRTSFHFIPDNGTWVQVIHSFNELKWSIQNLEGFVNVTSAVKSFVESIECTDEFAFSTPPFWLRVFTPLKGPSVLALVMHHALYDGGSVNSLLDVVQRIYRGESISYPVQFADLLPDFFRQELQNLERTLLPLHSLPSSDPYHISIRQVEVKDVDLKRLLTETEVTLQCLLQGALAQSLAILTRSADVVFGNVVSGRVGRGTEEVVGPILNTIPCRVHISDHDSVDALLQSIHRFNMEAASWQQASLRSIQKALMVDRIWDCLFTFQPLAPPPQAAIWSLDIEEHEDIHIQYPLHVEIEQNKDGFSVRCACQSNVLDKAGLLNFMDTLSNTVQQFVANPKERIGRTFSVPSPSNTDPTPTTVVAPAPATVQAGIIHPVLLSAIRDFAPDAEVTFDTPLPALGIDSITAIQISGKCRRSGLRLTATQILNSSTVKDLVLQATEIKATAKSTQVSDGVFKPLSSEEKDSIARRFADDAKYIENISVTTAGMKWAIGGWQRTNGSLFQYLFTFKLPDDVDHARFKNAWHMFIRRHELMRSTFATAPGGTEPRIVTFSKDFKFDHWAEIVVDDAVFYRRLLGKMKEMVSDPVPISRPPVRAALFRSDKQSYFIFHIHHFQYDAWSMQVLLNDLSSIYYDQEPWAVTDLRAFTSLFDPNEERLSVQRRFWEKALSPSFKPSLLPSLLNEVQGPLATPTGQPQLIMVPGALTNVSRYEEQARKLGVTLQTVLLAAWAQVQANRSRTSASTFGVWQVSRSGHIDGIERLAVPCVNVLPIHVKVGGSLVEVTKRIQVDLSERLSQPVIEHSDLVNISKWTGMSGETPIFNVNVNVVKLPVTLKRDGLVEPVKAPYYIPRIAVPTVTPTLDRLAVSPLCQNDVVVDIIVYEESDSILMSIEAVDNIMTEGQAKDIIQEWASVVSTTLSYKD
ncbi:peptide synthetase [Coprinopsis cinerea okayama7|uniref:Coprinoferrin synthetase n=1 Tax=Coprinopsis cinerea (strain Okayama-7 / 130 / ATCC MYA-4618 / FGSC 9003) TaxID=240176 RepID=CPF1_COPC7|nr:peptide synthetase [Coprinopsis cinerea okayama7\|eukprot:XP_001833231.2 peptide synthetase [Coprinopsis cinerea okayama7\